jgi:hypothetical protein
LIATTNNTFAIRRPDRARFEKAVTPPKNRAADDVSKTHHQLCIGRFMNIIEESNKHDKNENIS